MKTYKLIALIGSIAVALIILIPNLSWAADDGAGIYKAKCAVCHGVGAAGKPAANIPSQVSDRMKKSSDDHLPKAPSLERPSIRLHSRACCPNR
jgi:cytochrome c553